MLELALESDWEDVHRLSVQIHDLHACWRPDIYYHSDEPYPREAFLKGIEDKLVFVAKHHDTVIGYVVLSFISKGGPGTVEKKVMRLDSICVDEVCRGRGIGKAIMADVCALCRAFGCEELVLGVHPENETAIAFYQKCGFSIRTINLEMIV